MFGVGWQCLAPIDWVFPASCEYCVSECVCVSAAVINLVGGGAEQLRYQVTQGNTEYWYYTVLRYCVLGYCVLRYCVLRYCVLGY